MQALLNMKNTDINRLADRDERKNLDASVRRQLRAISEEMEQIDKNNSRGVLLLCVIFACIVVVILGYYLLR